MDTNWLRNELIRIVKEAEGREGGGGIAAFNERAQFTITGSLEFSHRSFFRSVTILISFFPFFS